MMTAWVPWFANDHFPSASLWWIMLGQMVLALAAAIVNLTAVKWGLLEAIAARMCAGILACVYFIAFGVLLFTQVDPTTWTEWVRALGLLAWPIVWIWPAWVSVRVARRLREAAERAVDREHECDTT